ncbi:MAG: YlxM family DNA-binding protein [Culicoidibacterales bacterium]
MLEQREKLIAYYDVYHHLLTDRQREYFESHYFEDLSFGEIAAMYKVSRAAIFDQLKRCEEFLLTIESKLGIIHYRDTLNDKLLLLTEHVDDEGRAIIEEIRAL